MQVRGKKEKLFISIVLGECVTVGVREERLVSLEPREQTLMHTKKSIHAAWLLIHFLVKDKKMAEVGGVCSPTDPLLPPS